MDIQFFGAAKMVTGSNFLVTTNKYKFLIDCGLFQGSQDVEELNYKDFPYQVEDIDFLILSHAHIDHSGRIPKLVKEGFRGKIICTKPTYELAEIMLLDSAKIQESDVEWENRKRKRAGKKPIEALYTSEDAERSLNYFDPYFYDQIIEVEEDFKIRFKDAGHILGSSIVEIWTDEGEKLVFSGDLGMPNRPIIRDPEFIESADYLILESTYGDEKHESYQSSIEKMIKVINETTSRGGTVIIPSFAVGRTQELVYELNKYYVYNNVEEYMKVPIYVDSPMAVNATRVFEKNSSSFDKEATDLILRGDNPFVFDNLRYVQSQEESMNLNKSNYPKVIISSSGMATGGRVRHHLKHNLWDERNTLLFVGYQAQGSLGRILLDGIKKVKLLGEEIDVKLEIQEIKGFSGHADQDMLLKWIGKMKKRPKKIFIVHGEQEAARVLADKIDEKYGIETMIPNLNDKYEIKNNVLEVKKGMTIEPSMLREDIEEKIEKIYTQFRALEAKKGILDNDKALEKDYSQLKNKLIELHHNLIDLNLFLNR